MQGHIHSGWEWLSHFSSALISQHHSESETLKIRGLLNSKQDSLHSDTRQVLLSIPVPTLIHGGGIGSHSDSLVSDMAPSWVLFSPVFLTDFPFTSPANTNCPQLLGGEKPLESPSSARLYIVSKNSTSSHHFRF